MNTTLDEPDTASEPEGSRRGARAPSWLLPAAAVVVAFVAGLGLTRAFDGAASGANGTVLEGVAVGSGQATSPVAAGEGVRADVPAPADATTPEAAVSGFLTAEIAGDHAASFAYLSADDRAANRTPVFWTSRHAHIAPIEGFRVTGTEEQRDGSVVVLADLKLRSSLDPVLGLVPAQAEGIWVAVAEGPTWRVAFERSELQGIYPDDRGAVEVAEAWAQAQVDCDETSRIPLYGTPDVAKALCGADGAVEVGQMRGLGTDASVSGLISAFGPEAASWARVVPLRSPVELGIVLAPVGDGWVVTAIVPAR